MERTDAWIDAALGSVGSSVVVGIVGIAGSSPRELGARMTVGVDSLAGSIGGGMLEYMAIRRARTLLASGETRHRLISFPLGPDTQQCCGGVITLFFEPVTAVVADSLGPLADRLEDGVRVETRLGDEAKRVASVPEATGDARIERRDDGPWLVEELRRPRFEIALFGAGHVGRALVRAVEPLPFRLRWFDPRPGIFPDDLPDCVSAETLADPPEAVHGLPPGSAVLVMTHSHPIDYEICCAALARADLAYVGLIGSTTKRNRFSAQLRRAGMDPQSIDRLVCPIGVPGIRGKEPAVIAASLAAQLLEVAERQRPAQATRQGISEAEADATPIGDVF